MIPVDPQPEPSDFDQKVRQPGQKWLIRLGVNPGHSLPKGKNFANHHEYWRESLKDLWEKYGGVCAYLCIYLELGSGAISTDHFIPKSHDAWLAYEWSNFRLSCLTANRDKSTNNILDPFHVKEGMFHLNFSNGNIFPNPALTSPEKTQVENTITVLKLNKPMHKSMRKQHYDEYKEYKLPKEYLKSKSPFVYKEAKRQGLL